MCADAITVSPYLGFGSLQPVIDLAAEHGGGVFVLALTSNPEGATVQHARRPDGRTVAQHMIDEISQVNAGVEPFGSVGAVIGATIGETGLDIDEHQWTDARSGPRRAGWDRRRPADSIRRQLCAACSRRTREKFSARARMSARPARRRASALAAVPGGADHRKA